MSPPGKAGAAALVFVALWASGCSTESRGGTSAGACPHPHWVAAWSTSMSDGSTSLENQTIRMVVTPHIDGRRLRIRLSNRFGTAPITLTDVRIARSGGGGAIAGPNVSVLFDGSHSVTIPTGAEATSDPLILRLHALRPLAISVFVPGTIDPVTRHSVAQQTSFTSPPGSGDVASDLSGSALPTAVASWLLVDSVEVATSRPIGAVVAFGDSTTEGEGSPVDADQRYPDFLAQRLLDRFGRGSPSVLNAGISGNGLVMQGNPAWGPAGRLRLQRDAIDQAGATDVILAEGGNDLSLFKARDVIFYTRRVIRRLHAAGLHVFVATVTPRGEPAKMNRQLRLLNAWIRARAPAPAIDFNRAVRDPDQPNRLAPRFDSGDGVHPNAAGYRAMAAAVPLSRLDGHSCGRSA
jgi:lysophospholipase L1-like esterase